MTTDPARRSDTEPTEQELRELAAEHDIDVPTRRPPLGLVRRSRYEDLGDELVATLVALAKAKDDARYWMGRFDEAHDRATTADLSAIAAVAAYETANERAKRAEAERDQLKQHQDDEPAPQSPTDTPHCTYSAAELARHLEDGCADCAATLPDQSGTFLIEVAHASRDAEAVVALFLLLQELDRRNLLKKATQ